MNAYELSTEERIDKFVSTMFDMETDTASQFIGSNKLLLKGITMDVFLQWSLKRSLPDDLLTTIKHDKSINTVDDLVGAFDVLLKSRRSKPKSPMWFSTGISAPSSSAATPVGPK